MIASYLLITANGFKMATNYAVHDQCCQLKVHFVTAVCKDSVDWWKTFQGIFDSQLHALATEKALASLIMVN